MRAYVYGLRKRARTAAAKLAAATRAGGEQAGEAGEAGEAGVAGVAGVAGGAGVAGVAGGEQAGEAAAAAGAAGAAGRRRVSAPPGSRFARHTSGAKTRASVLADGKLRLLSFLSQDGNLQPAVVVVLKTMARQEGKRQATEGAAALAQDPPVVYTWKPATMPAMKQLYVRQRGAGVRTCLVRCSVMFS